MLIGLIVSYHEKEQDLGTELSALINLWPMESSPSVCFSSSKNSSFHHEQEQDLWKESLYILRFETFWPKESQVPKQNQVVELCKT